MTDARMVPPGTAVWPADYLAEAESRPLCMEPYCTTCGAREFRAGVFERAARAVGLPPDERSDPQVLAELVTQLAHLNPSPTEKRRWEDSVRLILGDLWSAIQFSSAREAHQRRRAGRWAGSELETMRALHRESQEVRRRHARENSPEVIEARRAEKRRLRDERPAARRAGKQEIDRRGFEQHPRPPGPTAE